METGPELTIRPAAPEDAASVKAFLDGLSPESRRLRYHSPVPIVRSWMVRAVTAADHDQREALLAVLDGEVVGIAEWGRDPDVHERAHVAVAVGEGIRRKGIAQALLRRLSLYARLHGITEFVAHVLTVNGPTFGLIDRIAPIHTSRFDGDAVEVLMPLAAATGA